MNDLKILHDAWDAPEPPSHAAYAEARAALLARAPRRRRLPRLTLRRASLAGLAVLAVAGVGVAQNLGGVGASNASATEVLQRAAVAAQEQPFTAPRDKQWIYTEDKLTSSDDNGIVTSRRWRRADGGGFAFVGARGEVEVEMLGRHNDRPARPPTGPLESYNATAALPTDPNALLRWAYGQTDSVTGAGSTADAEVYAIFRGILGNGVLPPAVESAIFRAMKRIPGVTLHTVDVLGRPTLALALTDEWLRQEILLDPETYAYAGQRSTVVKDAVVSPEKAGNATGAVKQGDTVVAARVSTGIVDEPGRRP